MASIVSLLRLLTPYDATLVGTFPLGLQVEQSELDIACAAYDLAAFEKVLRAHLGEHPFDTERVALMDEASVTKLACDDLQIEVFAQATPVHRQQGFRHMIMEGRLLALGGDSLRSEVLRLKRTGLQTEPAFARALRLTGDPYEQLLKLESWDERRLLALIGAS